MAIDLSTSTQKYLPLTTQASTTRASTTRAPGFAAVVARGVARGVVGFFAVASLAAGVGCAEKQKPLPPPKADPAGLGVVVGAPAVTLVAGTSCADTVTQGVGERFAAATTSALTGAGFSVVAADADNAFSADLALEIDYCSDAGIVSGTTALTLNRKGGGSVWRGQATGDQARGETAKSTLAELVETMLYDPRVIKATETARQ